MHTSKLTEAQVVEIRRRSGQGEKGSHLAREFNVSPATISLLIRGVTWAHIQDGPIRNLPKRRRESTSSTEHWKSIPGYEGIYSVSDIGNVRIEVDRQNIRTGDHLRLSTDRDSYLFAQLADSESTHSYRIALLVLSAFVGPRLPKQESNHKDGNRQNNRIDNLEYVTKAENIQHSIRVLGHTREGASNSSAKLTEESVVLIRERAATGETYKSLGYAFGITGPAARYIAIGKTWKLVGGPIQGKRPIGRPPKR